MKLKKLIIMGLISCMAMSMFTGCGLVKTGNGDSKTDETEVVETEKAGFGDYLSNGSIEICVNEAQAFAWGDRYFLIIDMSYTNQTGDNVELKPDFFHVFTDNEEAWYRKYDSFNNMTYEQTSVNPLDYLINTHLIYETSTIMPGRTERGYIIYEYYRPFTDFEVQIAGIHVYATAADITVRDAESEVMMALYPPEETTEETPAETPAETTAAPTTEATTAAPTTEATTAAPAETPTDAEPTETTEAPSEE